MKIPNITFKMTLLMTVLMTFVLLAVMLISVNIAMSELMQIAVDSGLQETDTMQSVASSEWMLLLITTSIIALLIVGLVVYMAKNFEKPIHQLFELMEKVRIEKDLSLRAEVTGSSEVAQMAASYNDLLAQFEGLISSVVGSVGSLKEATQELSAVTENSSELTATQQSESQQLATAMNEMSATAQEVAKNAADAASAVHDAENSAQQSAEIAVEAMCAMDNLVAEVDGAAGVITKLEDDSSSIGMVLDVIKGIAEQTNLLALNAAIEAARAGEQGRGFAVVADEVRTLASRTQESTNEIQSMIEKLQSGTQAAVKVMMHAKELGEGGSAQTEATAEALAEISGSVKSISDMATQIASAAEEQTAVTEEMSRNIVSIADVADSTVAGSMQTAETTEHLKSISEQLQQSLGTYRC